MEEEKDDGRKDRFFSSVKRVRARAAGQEKKRMDR